MAADGAATPNLRLPAVHVLLDDPAWNAIEVPITRETLLRAQEIVVCNALRGPLRAVLAS